MSVFHWVIFVDVLLLYYYYYYWIVNTINTVYTYWNSMSDFHWKTLGVVDFGNYTYSILTCNSISYAPLLHVTTGIELWLLSFNNYMCGWVTPVAVYNDFGISPQLTTWIKLSRLCYSGFNFRETFRSFCLKANLNISFVLSVLFSQQSTRSIPILYNPIVVSHSVPLSFWSY